MPGRYRLKMQGLCKRPDSSAHPEATENSLIARAMARISLERMGKYIVDVLPARGIHRDSIFETDNVDALVRKFKRRAPTGTAKDIVLAGILSTELLGDCFIAGRPQAGIRHKTQTS